MVILHVKRTEAKNEFLYETTVTAPVEQVVAELVTVHNLRLKVLRTAGFVKDLAKYGPIRPEETRGLSEDIGKVSDLDVNAYGRPTNPDPYGYRTGCPPAPEVAAVLTRTAEEAEAAVAFALVAQRKCLEQKVAERMLELLKGACMIAYPAYHRLPAYDPARLELENKEELDGRSDLQDYLEVAEACIWWAGKELQEGKLLADFVGKNEKTKIVAKLCSKAAGAPVRESRIDTDTHKAMMAHYYQKQEENKKLMEDADDSYLQAEWANPRALKGALVGGGKDVTWRPR